MIKKILVIILGVMCYNLSYAQVGIGTKLPLQVFHLDIKQNNPVDKLPSDEQAKDDFVITKEGNVGIGSINPDAKLEINGTFRLKDGTEAENKILLSDKDGIAHWEKVPYDIPTIIGSTESNNKVRWTGGGTTDTYLYSGYKINLIKGRWVVNVGALVEVSNSDLWLLAIISSSKTLKQQNGFRFISVAKQNTAYAAYIMPGKGVVKGSSIIEVLDDNLELYVLLRKNGHWEFDPNGEQNYFYATPVL